MDAPAPSSRPTLVLIANDEEWTARSLETILGPNGYAVVRTYTGVQTLDLAFSVHPDIVLLSAKLPDLDSLEVCRRLRQHPVVGAVTPIFLLTSDSLGRAEAKEAYAAGIWDCMRLPLDGDLLLLKLGNFARARRAVDEMRNESLLDGPTGLYNLRGLARRIQEMAADAARRHDSLACIAIAPDTDALAEHAALLDHVAERMITHVGGLLRRHGRSSDVIARLSQHEFGLVATSTEREGILKLVERLRGALEAEPMVVEGRSHPLRLRVGYTTVDDFAAASIDALGLVVRAAAALRHARSAGSTSVVAFEDVPSVVAHN
jgi:diguanylate cyclase (GGDEF)-like protein